MIEVQLSRAEIKALREVAAMVLSGEYDLPARQVAALDRAHDKLLFARDHEAEGRKQDLAMIRRCLPCQTCEVKPVWGAAFLVCPVCGWESEYNFTPGAAVRSWNRQQKQALQ
ncbi:MAG: hypothetical protein WC551_09000 [Patescibacteria group bacterium]